MIRITSVRAAFVTALLVLVPACGSGIPEGNDALDPGAEIETGELEVQLDSAGLAVTEIEVSQAGSASTTALEATGRVTYDGNAISHLGPRIEGHVTDVHADLGQQVTAGTLLATLESPEVGSVRADLGEAEVALEIATENLNRVRRLEGQGISSRRELLNAEAEHGRAEAALRRAIQRLEALGASDGEGAEFTVRAPFSGVVVERHATSGEVVGPADRLFTVADLSSLWVELDIYERDLAGVAEGQAVGLTTAAFPNRVFEGHVSYLSAILDPERRTVGARVVVENPDGALRPGMFVEATIAVPGGVPIVAVPRDAVQTVEEQQAVFVPGDEPGHFVVRPVSTGRELADNGIEILSGLEADESLVTVGAFTLKAALAEGDFGGHEH